MACGFLGAAVVVFSSRNNSEEKSNYNYYLGIIVIVFGLIAAGISSTFIKYAKNIHFSIQNTFYGFFLTSLTLPIWVVKAHIFNTPEEYGFTLE